MSRAITQSLHEEAVTHAYLAERSGDLTWDHILAEWTQDVYKIADTLARNVPLLWALARDSGDDGVFRWAIGTTVDEVRDQYSNLREEFGIYGWEPILDIRQGWYTFMQGVSTLKLVSGPTTRGETVVLFPVGTDGILGELQTGVAGRLPDGSAPSDCGARVPELRLAVLASHDAYVEALRTENVDAIVAAHSPVAAVASRSYLTDESSPLIANGAAALGDYFSELFGRYRVRDVRLVNRVAETWYVFAELHWIVEERTGVQRALQFCTAELSPVDADGKYWVRTGAGTDPIDV